MNMRTKTDTKDWSEEQCDRWLAASPSTSLPCPQREVIGVREDIPYNPKRLGPLPRMEERHRDDCDRCNGSGRVPKAVGLEELMPLSSHWEFWGDGKGGWGCKLGLLVTVANGEKLGLLVTVANGETPLLAAKRAVCASLLSP